MTTAFQVTLKGAGEDKTSLTALDDADGIEDVFLVNWKAFDPAVWPGPILFHFYSPEGRSSDIAISDLTIEHVGSSCLDLRSGRSPLKMIDS